MKINVKEISYDKFLELEKYKHKKPMKRSFLLASVIRVISYFELLGGSSNIILLTWIS